MRSESCVVLPLERLGADGEGSSLSCAPAVPSELLRSRLQQAALQHFMMTSLWLPQARQVHRHQGHCSNFRGRLAAYRRAPRVEVGPDRVTRLSSFRTPYARSATGRFACRLCASLTGPVAQTSAS